MKKFVPVAALLLVLVVFSSGCTIPVLNIEIPGLDIPGFGPPVTTDTSDILVIKSMEVVPDTVDSGGTAQVVAYIQNVGDKPVGDAANPVVVDLYDYCQGLYTPTLLTCGTEESYTQDVTKCSISQILPKQTVPIIWSICQNKATPVKVKTVCPTEGVKMSVKYHYTTSSITTVSLIGLSEMQREMIERRYDTDNGYISLGQGPIKPVLTVEDKQPIPVYDIKPGSSQTNTDVINARTVLKLQLQNKGSGQLDSRMTVDGRSIVAIEGSKVKILSGIGSGENDLTPLAPSSDNPVPCMFGGSGGDWANEPIRMIGSESSPYLCTINIAALAGKVTMTTSRHIQLEVSYDYLITRSAMITIDPKIAG
jgi:hypothetical protein